MEAGKLRHRITIQRPIRTQNPVSGTITQAWEDVATVWASIEALSAREFIAAQAVQSKVAARVVIRYREGIDASMRILHKGKIYNIEGVLPDPKSGREYLTLPCSEGVNDG